MPMPPRLPHQPPSPLPEIRDERQHMWQLAGRYSALGIEVAACVVLGALGGNWLDERFNFTPWGFFAGTAIGCVAAIRALRRVIAATRKREAP